MGAFRPTPYTTTTFTTRAASTNRTSCRPRPRPRNEWLHHFIPRQFLHDRLHHPWRTSGPHQAACSPLCTHRTCYHAICAGRALPTPRRLDHQRPPPHTARSSTRSLGPHRRNFALGPWWRRRQPGIPASFTFICTSGRAPASKQCHSIGKTGSTPKTKWTHPRPRRWRPPTPSRVQKHSSTLRTNNPHSM